MKGFNPDRSLAIAFGTNLGPEVIRPDTFTKPEVNEKYRNSRLASLFNAQLKVSTPRLYICINYTSTYFAYQLLIADRSSSYYYSF